MSEPLVVGERVYLRLDPSVRGIVREVPAVMVGVVMPDHIRVHVVDPILDPPFREYDSICHPESYARLEGSGVRE